MSAGTLTNFGANIGFTPRASYAPRTEAEVLEVMEKHRGESIRAFGSLHSWSEAATTRGVAIDTRYLNHVQVVDGGESGAVSVRAGAGCTVGRLLEELRRQANLTLPSLGLIRQQTVAGATATGTHGSGAHSMSHYIRAARLAINGADGGGPEIRVITGGRQLEAVRCSLGALGVITELTLEVRPQYNVSEHFHVYDSLRPVLDAESEYPIQQFYLVPWTWQYYAQHRRETDAPRSLTAPLYRAFWIGVMDMGMHLAILSVVRLFRNPPAVRWFYRHMVRFFVPKDWAVVDRSDRQLTMNHHWFRHIEIELFVERDQLPDALEFTLGALRFFDGKDSGTSHGAGHGDEADGGPPQIARKLFAEMGVLEQAEGIRGRYTHHYPICVRKVLPDQTLLSMACGEAEARYAISLISYARPSRRDSFMAMARLLTYVMVRRFGARPHWGKVCPLASEDVERLYPRLPEFQEVTRGMDPYGYFTNEWTADLLGLAWAGR